MKGTVIARFWGTTVPENWNGNIITLRQAGLKALASVAHDLLLDPGMVPGTRVALQPDKESIVYIFELAVLA